MKQIPVEEILKNPELLHANPGFVMGWTPVPYGGMENSRFGKISCVATCNEEGLPAYTQPRFDQIPGAITVPYDEKKEGVIRIGMIRQYRDASETEFDEVPRGFGRENENLIETAIRECLEEAGLEAVEERVTSIGTNNWNPTYSSTFDGVFAIRFDDLDKMNQYQAKGFEKIKGSKPFTHSQIYEVWKKGQLRCGLTKAALTDFGFYKPEF